MCCKMLNIERENDGLTSGLDVTKDIEMFKFPSEKLLLTCAINIVTHAIFSILLNTYRFVTAFFSHSFLLNLNSGSRPESTIGELIEIPREKSNLGKFAKLTF